jgi:phage major head subunit gpT-like protein
MLTHGSELLKATAEQSFWNAGRNYPDPFDGLIFTRESTQSVDTLARLGSAPLPAEWIGDKEAKTVPELSYTITNVHYDATVRVDKALIQFQQWDEVGSLVANLGQKAAAHRAKLASDLLEAGFTTGGEGDDGQFFFDDDHADPGAAYSTNQDNDLTATGGTASGDPTAANVLTAIRAMIVAMYGFLDDQGHPQAPMQWPNASNLIVMYPPAIMAEVLQVFNADTITTTGDNDMKGMFTPRLNQWLTNTDRIYLFDAGSSHKPLIWNEASGLMLEDEKEFSTGHYLYSANRWGKMAYGDWRTAVSYIWT